MWKSLKSFAFRFDAEAIHDLTVKSLQLLGSVNPQALEVLSGVNSLEPHKRVPFLGKHLKSPVGLAAGFDKNALLLPYLSHLGFSHAEIGSVTLRAQSGNPKPRLFRGDERLFNRMGFNNDGAETVAKRLENYEIPKDFVLGINLGLNKDCPHDKAPEAYAETFNVLSKYGDYFVVNVSSPNTPGLRDLQHLSHIEKIFEKIKQQRNDKPVFLKLASEVSHEDREEFYSKANQMGIDGFVLTNTLKGEHQGLVGGWSGCVLKDLSREALGHALRHTSLPIISVGGIMDEEEAGLRMKMGARLIQIYTGWIFRGPRFPSDIAKYLAHEAR